MSGLEGLDLALIEGDVAFGFEAVEGHSAEGFQVAQTKEAILLLLGAHLAVGRRRPASFHSQDG